MAMTLDVSADMETLLCLKAAKEGITVTGYLMQLVQNDLNIDMSEYAGLEDYASTIAAIQAGLEDAEAGRSISLEEMVAEHEARRKARKAA